MEVIPEMYAWLTSLNIINPFLGLEEYPVNNFQIPEKTVKVLLGGKYMDIIINHLQDSYNKFYNVKSDFTSRLQELKDVTENQDYISNSVKYSNWNLIMDILKKFGLSFSEDDINKLVDGDKKLLLDIINKIYELNAQLLKDANLKKKNSKKSTNLVKNTNSNNQEKKINFKRLFIEPQKKKEDSSSTNIDKINKKNNFNLSQLNDTGIPDINNSYAMKKILQNNTLNINKLDEKKPYEECLSALEFFVLSLSKNFEMKPRQSVALLSNNRKYLSIICNKGINGSFKSVQNWLNDLDKNADMMIKLIKTSYDGLNIGFGTIGTAICSKDKEVPIQAMKLLNKINENIGYMNWDWLKKEGIDSIMFTISKHECNKVEIMNILYELIRSDINKFFDILSSKVASNEKKKVLEFLSNILPIVKQLNHIFIKEIRNFLYDISLNDKEDMSYIVSILSDAFYYFYPIEESIINKSLSYFKLCLKSNSLNVFGTSVSQMFNLIERIGQLKDKNAPPLYKNIVLLFLELYDNVYKREIFLENFDKFFNTQNEIPIDIFFEPYLNQLKSVQNYNLSDLTFLFKMVEHPRIGSHELMEIIQFLLSVCLNNVVYSRTANLVMSLIFEKKIIQQLCSPSDNNELTSKFVDFINNALELFMSSITNLEDKAILEMPYDLISENFPNVKEQVHDKIVKCVKEYRKIKKENSNALLAILWNYPDHDDIILQMEEENRTKYEPMHLVLKKKKKEEEESEKKNYQKKTQNYIKQIEDKNKEEKKEIKNAEKKLKEDKIKKDLAERRRIIKVMSGVESPRKTPRISERLFISTTSSKNSRISKKKIYDKNRIQTGNINSNMIHAINSATRKFKEKRNLSEQYIRTNINQDVENYKNDYVEKKNKYHELYDQLDSSEEKPKKVERKHIYNNNKEIKKSLNMLIQPEGKYIKIEQGGVQIHVGNQISKKSYLNSDVKSCYGLPIDLEEEEERELKAIKGYTYEYKKNIKFFFKSYANELTQTITKAKLIRMFRDKGINKERLDVEEVNDIIRNLFNDNIIDFDFNQFCNLLVQISYLLYIKRRPTLTIGETYGILLSNFKMPNQIESSVQMRKKMGPVINLLLDKKANNEAYNLPEGFKFIKKTKVKYNSFLPQYYLNILGESKLICFQVLEEIIYNIFNSSIIEPYVESKIEDDIELEPEKMHKWTPEVYMAYIGMDKEYNKIGIEVADALEEGFKKLLKGKNQKGEIIIHPLEKKLIEEEKREIKKENKRLLYFAQRREEIKEKLEEYREKRKEEYENKKRLLRKFKLKRKKEMSEVKIKFEEIIERRQKREEEKKKKEESEQEKKRKKDLMKIEKVIKFLTEEKRKINKYNKEICQKKQLILKMKEKEKIKEGEKPPISPVPDYFEKNKEYIKFERELNNTISDLLEREDIKKIFDDYKEHLQFIYNTYSKIDSKNSRITFNFKEGIRDESFKQFLIHFTVLGLLVSSDQMTYIYKNITKATSSKRNNQSYLDYHDFEMALCYLSIFARFADRERRIVPSDIDNINGESMETFFKYLGLELPYDKFEFEKYINERRSMTVKELINLQQEIRKNDVNEFKKTEMEKEEKKKKEMKKKIMEMEKKKKEQEKLENEKKNEKDESQIELKEQKGKDKNINKLNKNK